MFDRSIDEINTLKPDFAIMVGDLIQGNTTDLEQLAAEWKEFWQHESDLIVPFLPLPGNHDITNPVMYDYWKEHLGRTYSAFVYKDCLFITLNTEEWHHPSQAEAWDWEKGWFGEEQTKYVEDELAKHLRLCGIRLFSCTDRYGFRNTLVGNALKQHLANGHTPSSQGTTII